MERDTTHEQPKGPNCGDCKHFFRSEVNGNTVCRRNPPIPQIMTELVQNKLAPNMPPRPVQRVISVFPPVDDSILCGEYTAQVVKIFQ